MTTTISAPIDTVKDLHNARYVFFQNNGKITQAYYNAMNERGFLGQLAVALFRAQKRSTAAKRYRARGVRQAAYEVKNWSLSEVCRILSGTPDCFCWGWKYDPGTPGYHWVLYVDIPTGQVSFHSPDRLSGPDYPKEWDGIGKSEPRIIEFCNYVGRPQREVAQ